MTTDPRKDPRRRCLKVDDWPERDQELWHAALRTGDVLDDSGPAAHWRPGTVHKYRRGYGRWLTFLQFSGQVDLTGHPGDRVTRDRVRAYVSELQATVGPGTVLGRIRELHAVARVLAPHRDWSWLQTVVRRLAARCPRARDKRPRLRSSRELFTWALATMDTIGQGDDTDDRRQAVRYRDALIIGFLAARPLRRGNLGGIRLDRQLIRDGAQYRLHFDEGETKTGRPIAFMLPDRLVPYLDAYLATYRPLLLRNRSSDHLWINWLSDAMDGMSIYRRVVKVTDRAFGRPMNPHLFRDCAATSIAEEDPEHVHSIMAILGHTSLRTSEKYYNQARGREAGRRYIDHIRILRKRFAGRTDRHSRRIP